MSRRRPLHLALLAALGVLLPFVAPARARADVQFGVDVGPSIVWTAYDEKLPAWDTGNRIDVSGGVTAKIGIDEFFSVVTGVRYSGLGTHVDVQTIEGDGTVDIHQSYLVVPAWFRYDFAGERALFLQIGVEGGYLLSGSSKTEEPLGGEVFTSDESITEDLERTNISLAGGVGVRQPIADGDRTLEFTLRYARGLTGVAKEEQWFSDWKTREIHLSLGIR